MSSLKRYLLTLLFHTCRSLFPFLSSFQSSLLMTATTVAPPVTEPDLYCREPEVLARRSPSVKSSADSRRNASTIARQSSVSKHDASSHSQSSTLDSSNHHGSNGKRRSQESLARKASERRRVLRVGNYVIYRKTIGAGSMGKVKLAECLTDSDRQQVRCSVQGNSKLFFSFLMH